MALVIIITKLSGECHEVSRMENDAMKYLILSCVLLFAIGTLCYAQESAEYTLLVGEFENKSEVANPLLSFLDDTLGFLFSRSQLAEIHPITPLAFG